jgi:hypothetical protein
MMLFVMVSRPVAVRVPVFVIMVVILSMRVNAEGKLKARQNAQGQRDNEQAADKKQPGLGLVQNGRVLELPG